ncbi:hypothetical protein D3C76_1058190 [compost metagenome]
MLGCTTKIDSVVSADFSVIADRCAPGEVANILDERWLVVGRICRHTCNYMGVMFIGVKASFFDVSKESRSIRAPKSGIYCSSGAVSDNGDRAFVFYGWVFRHENELAFYGASCSRKSS